jgi:predicted amidohydrolase
MKLIVATCQFPVDADIRRNTEYVLRQMRHAKARGADVAHFPETSLSGYAGVDFASYRRFDWDLLAECARRVLDLARELKLWLVVGSTHRLTGRHKPHDSLYIVDDDGNLVDRYDKMFCAGDHNSKVGDLAHYSPGNHFAVFDLKGVRCGALICHEYRYPELYREYKKRGVDLIFHSYHAGHVTPKRLKALEAGRRDVSQVQSGEDPSRHYNARSDARGRSKQSRLDQLQQYVSARKLLAEPFCASRWRYHGVLTSKHGRNSPFYCRYKCTVVRFDICMERPRDAWCIS